MGKVNKKANTQIRTKKSKTKVSKFEELKLISKKKRGRPRKEESESYLARFTINECGYTPSDEE